MPGRFCPQVSITVDRNLLKSIDGGEIGKVAYLHLLTQ